MLLMLLLVLKSIEEHYCNVISVFNLLGFYAIGEINSPECPRVEQIYLIYYFLVKFQAS